MANIYAVYCAVKLVLFRKGKVICYISKKLFIFKVKILKEVRFSESLLIPLEILFVWNNGGQKHWLIKEQYPVTAHAPNFDFWTGCREFKRCEHRQPKLTLLTIGDPFENKRHCLRNKYWDMRTLNNVKSTFSFDEINKKDLPVIYSTVFRCLLVVLLVFWLYCITTVTPFIRRSLVKGVTVRGSH